MLSFGQTIANAAGLKSRKKLHFEVAFTLEDLSNCTYVSGVLFAKIRLKEGGHFSHSSRHVEISSHNVRWKEEVKFSCKLYASANTAELEPCICKVSVRKETRGGRSYKKLGYVPINLSEFAGAGVVQRKYLLESYNENKHKPDNSILRVKVALRQTSGDVLFKAPRPPVWEISEPEQDEGIQADLQSSRRVTHNARVSTASTLSGFSGGSGSGNVHAGSSLQDMRGHVLPTSEAKSSSACSLHAGVHASSDSGSSEYESASQHSSSSGQDTKVNKDVKTENGGTVVTEKPAGQADSRAERSNSVAGSELRLLPAQLPPDSYSLSYPRFHRRESGNSNSGSPSKVQHRRIQSLSITPNSSRSTSAYSTLSERSAHVVASEETESVISTRTRVTTQSQVEQSRVDPTSVIDELLQQQQSDLGCSAEEEPPGLQIYVDRSKGDVVVAGANMERRDMNLKPIELPAQASSRQHRKLPTTAEKISREQPSSPTIPARTDSIGTGTMKDTQ